MEAMMIRGKENLVVRAERSFYKKSIDIVLFVDDRESDQIGVARPITIEKQDRFSAVSDPMLSLPTAVAQELMDELWRCGLRPSEGTGSAGSLAATERHLEDMRRIAFGTLAIDKVAKP